MTGPKASSRSESPLQSCDSVRGGVPTWAAAAVLALSIGAVYFQSLGAPFIFDDDSSILGNDSIVSLWPLVGTTAHPGPLRPQAPLPTAGRPVVNFSLALNYFVGGAAPIGYRIVNVLIHFGSALLLWAIIRRTLQLPYFAGRFDATSGWLALAASLIWALHPLQTEAVVYTTQRTELMMAFFYLATLYGSVQYWLARQKLWLTLAIVVCLAGMGSKEVMVSAPLIVLLFDRTFISGSLRKTTRTSWPLYLGLATTWLLLLALNMNLPRGDSAGFQGGPALINSWLTQCQVLLMYLKLAIWPAPLLIHYQLPYLESFGQAWIFVVPVLLLGIATLILVWRNSPIGFLGAWFFAILAPTSVVPILTEVAAERRMYLPLAALVVLLVLGGYRLVQFILRPSTDAKHAQTTSLMPRVVTVSLAGLVAIVLAVISEGRVRAYNDPTVLWRQVVQQEPKNFVAHCNLGARLLGDSSRQAEAISELQTALSLYPEYGAALCNLGSAQTNTGQFSEAIKTLHRAIALDPKQALGHVNLGIALTRAGRLPEAIDALHAALALEPNNFDALNNLGLALTELGHPADAIEPLRHALQLQPNQADAHNNLGRALTNAHQLPEAIDELNAARKLMPRNALVLNNLGFALTQAGNPQEGVAALEEAVQIRPDFALAHNNLAIALFGVGQAQQAAEHLRLAIKFDPKDANAYANLANLLANSGNLPEAISHYEQAVELQPNRADFHKMLADFLRQAGKTQPAIEHYQTAVRLQPDFTDAYISLVPLLAQADKSDEAVAAAKKAIALAGSSGQQAAAEQLEEWLKHYQKELSRAATPNTSQSQTPARESKPPQ
jgi:tetratricopeptide (TPR) repeat protein